MTSASRHRPGPLGRLAALVATLGLVAVPCLCTAASAADPRTPAPSPAPEPARLAAIDVNGVRPTVVTTSTGPTVVVEGVIRNTGDRVLHSLAVRLQRGQPARQAAHLRTELADDVATFEINGEFQTIAEQLRPGQTTGFSITMPLSGPAGLQISDPGVYPILVNLNATPDYGDRARVADSRTLLPVLSLPPNRDRAREYRANPTAAAKTGLGPDGSVAAATAQPAPFTMLWPIAAPAQTVPGRVGAGATDHIVLVNEALAHSLAPGGRLHNLLVGLRPVMTAGADDPRVAVRDSLCLAIDPDLLVTVSAMTRGYAVPRDPADPTGATTPGRGQADAKAWLAELTKLAAGRCTVALPYAGADLDALHRVGNTALTRLALADPADLVDKILDVKTVRGMALPGNGRINTASTAELAKAQIPTALVASSTVTPRGKNAADGQYVADRLRVATFDRAITAALGAAGSQPHTAASTPADQRVDLSGESAVSRRQAALAALAFPSIVVPDPRFPVRPGDPLPVTGRSSVISPPAYWSVTPQDATDLATTAGLLLRSGAAKPAALPAVITATSKSDRRAALADPATDGWWLPSEKAATSMDASANLTWQLQAALVRSPGGSGGESHGTTPQQYMAPLRYDLLRAIPGPDGTAATRTELRSARGQRVSAVSETLERMKNSVRVLDPGGRYTQVSERSPLLLVTRNELALPIRVRIETAAPLDFTIGDVGVIEIPARGTRQVQFPANSANSESTSVTFTLVSASGVLLGGDPIKLSVNSNAYGKPLFVVTLIAAAVLVLLVARRLWRRFRGTPDPADADRPEVSVQDRFLAGRDYSWRQVESAQHPPGAPDD
ncbi:DUF6049 family protein [Gordonia crocea]|uniref:Glycoprotein n=1 Tax=Gordonia crocea TaxID=589162 RepID=A0A7M3SU61_9ACTN|nr:DUF6049 family protein [Gordonia crocea]GED96185.1 hypothetical protein nbrc107697_02240 [Gordonia crocea]